MAIYVDNIVDWGEIARARGLRHAKWCHLFADTREELHEFGSMLGLRRSWFQDDPVRWHYDITPSKRTQALRLGAVEVDHGFVADLMNRRRECG